jgi:antitoxin component YwqK of YwqJK toxin-antitoxin module
MNFLDGKFNGEYKKFFPNGVLRELEYYVKDSAEGEHKTWNDAGQLLSVHIYENNMLNGICT